MNNWAVAASVGGVVFLTGVLLLWTHIRAWRGQKHDPSLEAADREHYHRRYRRRMQTSGMIALLGILIPLGDAVIPWREAPAMFAVYWGMLLLLAFWVGVQGLGDLFSTGAHSRAALARIREQQRELQQQLAKSKRRGSNGQHSSD